MPKKFPIQSKGFHPFGDLIGLQFTKLEQGKSQCTLEVSKNLFNPHKSLHGGVVYSMADTGMGAALYPLLEEDELCATVEVKISYFKPVTNGLLTCNTKVIHKGKRIGVLDSEILNGDRLIGKASGTFSIFKVK